MTHSRAYKHWLLALPCSVPSTQPSLPHSPCRPVRPVTIQLTPDKFAFETTSWAEDKETVGDLTLARIRTDRTLTGSVEGKGLAMYIM